MPGYDGSGPEGRGAKTGRGQGYCVEMDDFYGTGGAEMAAKKGSCGGTPRVGKKGDPKPRRGAGRRRRPRRGR